MDETHDTPSASAPEKLTPLDPRYKTLMRTVAAIVAFGLFIAATISEFAIDGWTGVVWVPAVLVIAYIVLYLPMRRYATRGYSLAEERLRVVRGVLFHSDTVVPFGRVQHIDVDQGPLERGFGLATLTVHTAGSHNASVSLPGLAHEDALAMREDIRAAIRRDTQ
ncbi:PH domain-containing protein [Qipengyuania polymorpha]|nr:PH domain-containing protein [Qipengyuania polymorpha]